MKKTLTLSIVSSVLLIAGNPIHDLMDNRIKGKSYSGSLDDNTAAEDGLGILPLQHHSGTTEINNELLIQKVLNKIEKSEDDKTKTVNIRNSLINGTVGTVSDLNFLNNAGLDTIQKYSTASGIVSISDFNTMQDYELNFDVIASNVSSAGNGLGLFSKNYGGGQQDKFTAFIKPSGFSLHLNSSSIAGEFIEFPYSFQDNLKYTIKLIKTGNSYNLFVNGVNLGIKGFTYSINEPQLPFLIGTGGEPWFTTLQGLIDNFSYVQRKYSSCKEIKTLYPSSTDGVYTSSTSNKKILCDMTTDGGGWTLISSNSINSSLIPAGTARNNANYKITSDILSNQIPSINSDYIIGSQITNIPFTEAKVYGVRTDGVTLHFKFNISSVSSVVDFTTSNPTFFSDSNLLYSNVYNPSSNTARYCIVDGVGKNVGFNANYNQSTVGIACVNSSTGDTYNGTYIGHGKTENTRSAEGWYDSYGSSYTYKDANTYTSWIR